MNLSAPSMAVLHTCPDLELIECQLGVAASELREVARCLRDRGAPRLHPHYEVPPSPTPFPVLPGRGTKRGKRFVNVAVAAGAAVIAAGVLGVVPAAGNRYASSIGSSPSAVVPEAQAALQARIASTYVWSAVPGAQEYAVAVVRGGRVVFEATTAELEFRLPARLRLLPGRYTLTVVPDSGPASPRATARPLVEATFLVVPS